MVDPARANALLSVIPRHSLVRDTFSLCRERSLSKADEVTASVNPKQFLQHYREPLCRSVLIDVVRVPAAPLESAVLSEDRLK